MKQCFILLAFMSVMLFNACSKDEGVDVADRKQGIAGADGTALLNGNGAPSNTLGKNGDFYLDKSTISIYGPKTDAGWGEPTALKGKDGKDGKDGSRILSGNQIPTMQDGAVGDFYFDTQNIAIYGPKTASGWGNPIGLKTPSPSEITVLLYKNVSFSDWILTNPISDSYESSRIIAIDSKYHEYYTNGVTVIQGKISNEGNGIWRFNYLWSENDGGFTVDLGGYGDSYVAKDHIKVTAGAHERAAEERAAFKIDIKIVFIPATKVIEMQSKNINTKDFQDIKRHLKL